MIKYFYTNSDNVSLDEIKAAKKSFEDKLSIFKEEFEKRNGTVTIHFGKPDMDGGCDYTYNLDGSIGEFNIRWNEYIKSLS